MKRCANCEKLFQLQKKTFYGGRGFNPTVFRKNDFQICGFTSKAQKYISFLIDKQEEHSNKDIKERYSLVQFVIDLLKFRIISNNNLNGALVKSFNKEGL